MMLRLKKGYSLAPTTFTSSMKVQLTSCRAIPAKSWCWHKLTGIFSVFFHVLKKGYIVYTKVTKNSNSNFSPQYWAYGLTQNSSLQKLLDHRIFLIRQSGVWSSEFNKVKQNLKQVSCSTRQIVTARECKACWRQRKKSIPGMWLDEWPDKL